VPHLPILVAILGEPPEPVVRVHGPFTSWYERAIGEPLVEWEGRRSRLASHVRDFAGIIVSGSASSLAEPEAWMDDACEVVVRAHDAGVPVLGVCFGHQLVGRAFGGRVIKNPRGFEVGTATVELTDEGRRDPLFAGLPAALLVNLTHYDMVDELTPAIRVLAHNEHTPVQALAVGDQTRGVQFHPEFDGSIMRAYLEARRPVIAHRDPDVLIAEAADTPDGIAVIRNFREQFVARS